MSVLHELLSVIAPPVCAACGDALPRADGLVCARCLRELPWIGGAACRCCGLPAHRGRACPAADRPFDSAWAPLAYEGVARDLVTALKFRGALPLAGLMAGQMAANAPPLPAGAVVVAVPPSGRRLRRRGFDPAGLIARAFAQRTGRELRPALRRVDHAQRQTKASRAQRREIQRLRFQPRGPAPAVAILLDDVHTTGATLRAAAGALRDGGAGQVHVVTYARTL